MTTQAMTAGDRATPLAPVILFGIDSSGKPTASRSLATALWERARSRIAAPAGSKLGSDSLLM
jgi:hypothetical protein